MALNKTLKIEGFKKEFKISTSSCLVDIKDDFSINNYLLKYHRCYVVSKKMQNQVLRGNYKITN